GSEGMLFVVTEVTVKLLPKPQGARVIMASFDDVEKAGNAVAAVIAAGIIPAGLEMMDRPATHAVEQFVAAGYDLEAAAILLCESDGTPAEVEDEIARMRAVLEAAGAVRMAVSRDEAERLRFWSGRKAAFPAVGRISPDYYCMDGTIPRKRLGEVLNFIAELEAKYGLRCPNVFHAGDGNLHPLILFDANDAGELRRTEAFAAEVLEKCVAVGGTITGEHGVGVEKINQMCTQFRPDELELFHAVKRAFDPRRLLNPGKAVPTLARCAEYGRMHVRGRALPLAELEETLAAHRQCLAFEPPHFGAATFGGCIAAGLSGPRRAAAGALRDFVLGVKLIDGRARLLQFGGQVMKNVAGYDVSRLLAGSLGTLGLIAEASVKVLPQPQAERTLHLEVPQAKALDAMNRWAGEPLPISATAWHDEVLYVRLSGSEAALRAAVPCLGGAELAEAPGFWRTVREQTHAFFAGAESLW